MNLKTRLFKLEQDATSPAFPLVIAKDSPDLEAQIVDARKHGRVVIVVNEIDERL